ncbi:hypothetical protein NKH73_31885 [Mesorhizobium sp. M0938]
MMGSGSQIMGSANCGHAFVTTALIAPASEAEIMAAVSLRDGIALG